MTDGKLPGGAEQDRERDSPLSFLTFLRDRFYYMSAFLIAVALSSAALILGSAFDPEGVGFGTAAYAGLLVFCCLLLWLAVDYLRQRTYRRQLRDALRQADDLDAVLRVDAGTSGDQIAAQRLLRAQHEAYMEELGRYRREQELHRHFVHQWVHQMKTPISVIDLIAQQAAETDPAGPGARDERETRLSSIREEADRLSRGLDMMLYTARLGKFEMDLHVRTIPLEQIARQAVNGYKRLCIRHSIFPRIEGTGKAQSDEKWLAFVLSQLIGNAVKYSKGKPGSKTLLLRIERLADGGSALSVIDEGIGVPVQDLPRVFDPFFTGGNGRLVEESTGMGLYLAKQVCAKLGHVLRIASVPGEGTTATIDFRPRSLHGFADT